MGSETSAISVADFDVAAVRRDFPILARRLPGDLPLVYLDTGATSQKPTSVIAKTAEVYAQYNANVHRGVHTLGDQVTSEMEEAREKIRALINAPEVDEVIFTSGTTMSINLVARAWGGRFLKSGDELLLNEMEHHANLVPWQQIAQERGATLRFIPLTPDGRLDLEQLDSVLTDRTRLVAVTGMSNVLGTINPIGEIASRARQRGALTLVDGAQSVPHDTLDVQALGIDFLAFSGHKLYGPTGVGVLWGKRELLESMDPFLGGGNMIRRVWKDRSDFGEIPAKFEAGTPPIAQAIGLGTAIDYVHRVGFATIAAYERKLTHYAYRRLSEVAGLRILGPAEEHRGSIVSFVLEGLQANDVSEVLDRKGIAVRAGHHCTMPLHDLLGISASVRASLAFYNTTDEIDALVDALEYVRKVLTKRR